MPQNFLAYGLLVFIFFISGCSTDTINSLAVTPLTSTTSDLFSEEVSQLSDYAYDKGNQLAN